MASTTSTSRLWLWCGLAAAAAAACFGLRLSIGDGYHLGDIGAVALMTSAAMVCLVSQRQSAPLAPAAEE